MGQEGWRAEETHFPLLMRKYVLFIVENLENTEAMGI